MDKLEEIVKMAIELRNAHQTARDRFYSYLWKVELEEMDFLRSCGYGNFGQFVRTHDLCEYRSYVAWCNGAEKIGADTAIEIGEHATRNVGRMVDEKAGDYVSAVRDWSEANRGKKPSEQASRRLCANFITVKRPRHVRYKDRVALLQEENQKLRAENRRLRSELQRLGGFVDPVTSPQQNSRP